MQHTSVFCRAQEVQHRTRAAGADLDNVRTIAIVAADAWAKEAVLADRRQLRHSSKLAELAASKSAEQVLSEMTAMALTVQASRLAIAPE